MKRFEPPDEGHIDWGEEIVEPTVIRPPSRDRMIRLRLMLVGLSISMWAVAAAGRLVHLQIVDQGFFQLQAARQSERTIRLDSRRGRILDRNGRQLAVSVEVDSIYADPQQIEHAAGTAAALARVLGMDARAREQLRSRLEGKRAFAWVRRKVDSTTARAIRDLGLPGVAFLTETRRYYPKRELASHLLGWVGLDNIGMSGVEYALDEQIRGRAAKLVVRTDARRRLQERADRPSTMGHDVILTIDERIQHVAERELDKAVTRTRSIAGTLVVMEPRSGEVLALVNRPTFNPNRYSAFPRSHRRNRAVLDSYEPGSIFKIITAAAALQEGVVDPDEMIDCGDGFITIAGQRINDHAVFDELTFRDVIAKSSDIGVIRVAQRLGRENFNRYVRSFGFGEPTGVGIAGEASGILRPTKQWSALSLASISFGQEIGVTAVQMAAAIGAVANGGYLMKPTLVRRIVDVDGRVVEERKPLAVRRVLEPETVDRLLQLMREVVLTGTGRNAAIAGYTVAGKTGTAQKVDASGGYSKLDHVASFVGFAPASRPAIVVIVSLDTPKGERNEGGDVAAPLFASVAEAALRHLAVPPDDADRVLRMMPYRPESIIAASYRPQPPSAGPLVGEPHRMPDLRGRSAREAALHAARRGLLVELRGSGRVVDQSPAPGAEIRAGQLSIFVLEPQAKIESRPPDQGASEGS